jgi:lambda repressor-like predicted transcriptional regulator
LHAADIQAALKKSGVSQAVLARRLGVTKGAVTFVVQGRSKSRRIAEAIAQIVGHSIDELWPGTYDDEAA